MKYRRNGYEAIVCVFKKHRTKKNVEHWSQKPET